jgi:hypothetical protein
LKILDKILDGLSNTFLPSSNDGLKVVVLCVFTATTFWFFNALNDNYTTKIKYPIAFTFPDSTYIAVSEITDNVEINLSGGGWNLLRRTFWFTIDPLEIPLKEPAKNSYILGSSLVTVISDQINELQLNFIETDTIWLAIDSIKKTKSKLLVDSLNVNLKKNYRITSPIKLGYDSVEFTGPQRFIDKIPGTILLTIPDKGIGKDYNEEIELPTFGSSLVNRNPVEVPISFKVEAFILQELMIPYLTINAPMDSSNYVFDDSLAYLNFQIEERLAGKFNLDSIKIVVDYKKLDNDINKIMPEIQQLPQILKDRFIQIDSLGFKFQ